MSNRPTTDERLGQRTPQLLVRYFLLIMAMVYLGLGLYLAFAPGNIFALTPVSRRLLGFVFVMYGILRFARTYKQHFQKNSHDAR